MFINTHKNKWFWLFHWNNCNGLFRLSKLKDPKFKKECFPSTVLEMSQHLFVTSAVVNEPTRSSNGASESPNYRPSRCAVANTRPLSPAASATCRARLCRKRGAERENRDSPGYNESGCVPQSWMCLSCSPQGIRRRKRKVIALKASNS